MNFACSFIYHCFSFLIAFSDITEYLLITNHAFSSPATYFLKFGSILTAILFTEMLHL